MYNYFMLMGRLTENPEVKELADGKRVMNLKLAVNRCFQNSKGKYDTDFFTIIFWDYLIEFAQENLKKGQPVLIKGRLQTQEEALVNGEQLKYPVLIGERVMSFCNS